MFPYPIATPQGCNIQTFYGAPVSGGANRNAKTWNKPIGVSHVYMMLIGGGGTGDGTSTGGGSGSVTVWYGAAQHVPNSLLIICSAGAGSDTLVQYRGNTLVTLLYAVSSTGVTGGAAASAQPFSASGFYKSTAGQDGIAGSQTASSTTFLSGGGSTGNNIVSNYGYRVTDSAATGKPGFFQMQPIIVGAGSTGAFEGSIGCGGGQTSVYGGPGMVLIASW